MADARPGRRAATSGVVAFAAAGGLVLIYALRGGSYDLVARQEVAVALWWILGLGWALGVLPRHWPFIRRCLWPLVALAALGAWTAASLLWTSSAERTFAELARVAGYGGLLALVVSVSDRGTWRAAAAGLAAAAAVVCALAVSHRLASGGLGRDYVAGTFGSRRLSYPLGYWNGVGAWGAMTLAAGLAWSAHARSGVARGLALAAVPIAVTAVYLSFSRAAIVGSGLGVIAVVVLGPRHGRVAAHALAAAAASAAAILVVRGEPAIERGTGTGGAGVVTAVLVAGMLACVGVAMLTPGAEKRLPWRLRALTSRRAVVVACAAIAIPAVVMGPALASRAWRDFKRTPPAESADPAARLTTLSSARYDVWRTALSAVGHRPVLGLGAGTFQFWHDRHARDPQFVRDAHSLYLESLAELGIPGLAAVVVFVALLLGAAVRARRRLRGEAELGAAAALIAGFVVFLWQAGVDWMWEETAVGALALGGAALAAVARAEHRPRAHGRIPTVARVAVAVFACLAALVQLPGLVSTSEARRSASALQANAPDRALADADDAVAAEPWSATALEQRALVEESTGGLAGARIDELRAIAREPQDWSHELVLARIEAELGHPAAALAAFRAARRLRPRAEVFTAPAG